MDDRARFSSLDSDFRNRLELVVTRLLGRRLAGKVDASDVVNQGLLVAHAQRAQFKGDDSRWQAWVLAIVRRETLKVVRYWHQQRRDVDREQALPGGSSSAGDCEPADERSSPSHKAVCLEQTARLLAAIDRLPPDYQAVIRLRNFEELSYAEIAEQMGRSPEAVRVLWTRALQRLGKELGDDA
jgi:RNA polymerase sigma-70 factor (ECF subfamily)